MVCVVLACATVAVRAWSPWTLMVKRGGQWLPCCDHRSKLLALIYSMQWCGAQAMHTKQSGMCGLFCFPFSPVLLGSHSGNYSNYYFLPVYAFVKPLEYQGMLSRFGCVPKQ